jgi:hypothetical protein
MNTTIKVVATIFLMFIFFWTWPIRLFTEKNNCYFYTLENLIKYGGKCKWYQSQWWWGYHVSYIKDGYEYHYDMTYEERKKIKGFPFFYNGKIRKTKYKTPR